MTARGFGAFNGDNSTGFMSLDTDLYSLLNVEKSASIKEIERKYRRISRFIHPDKVQGDDRQDDTQILINRAYQYLT